MLYTLRSKSGEMKAKVSNLLASKFMNESHGIFRNVKYTSGVTVVFEFTKDMCWEANAHTEIFIWVGDRLVPSNRT